MRKGLISSSIVLSRATELAAGVGTALLGVAIYIYIATKDASIQTGDEPSGRSVVVAFLMLVVPGVFRNKPNALN